ncbi:MAG: zinc-finger domain-containing protein [Bacillota bacterium]|nr:zinc-finger domain-containing protein [Bacillota bacterium]
MKETERQELLANVEFLIEHYCNGCFLHKHLKDEGGRRKAHRFCITSCTVGEKLRECGGKLS